MDLKHVFRRQTATVKNMKKVVYTLRLGLEYRPAVNIRKDNYALALFNAYNIIITCKLKTT